MKSLSNLVDGWMDTLIEYPENNSVEGLQNYLSSSDYPDCSMDFCLKLYDIHKNFNFEVSEIEDARFNFFEKIEEIESTKIDDWEKFYPNYYGIRACDLDEKEREYFSSEFYKLWEFGDNDLGDNPNPWGCPWLWDDKDNPLKGHSIKEMAKNFYDLYRDYIKDKIENVTA